MRAHRPVNNSEGLVCVVAVGPLVEQGHLLLVQLVLLAVHLEDLNALLSQLEEPEVVGFVIPLLLIAFLEAVEPSIFSQSHEGFHC